MMDWENKIQATNISEVILIAGILKIASGDTVVIDPSRHSDKIINDLRIFEKRGQLELTNNITIEPLAKKDSFPTKGLEIHGIKKAITVSAIDTNEKAIKVETYINEIQEEEEEIESVTSSDKRMTEDEAVEMLSLHWKTFQSQLNSIVDARKINYLQIIAQKTNAGDKKKQLIADRLNEI